jgi:hypothetical protein
MRPLRRFSMHSRWALFFPFWGGLGWGGMREVIFLFFFLFPNVFSTFSHQILKGFLSSQSVPKWVPEDVLNTSSILSHIVCTEFNSHVHKLKMYPEGEYICFYFSNRVQKGASIGGMANNPKTLLIGQSTWLLHRNKKKKCEWPMN